MKEQHKGRLKRALKSSDRDFPIGARVVILSIDESSHPPTFEADVQAIEGEAAHRIKLSQDDLLMAGDVEIYQSNPISLLSIRPFERLNKDVHVEVQTIITNPAGATLISNSKTWLLFDDIVTFVNELAALQAKESNKVTLSSAAHGELSLSVWQRKGLPVAILTVGRERMIQSQSHQDCLSSAFEIDTPLQEVIDGFRKLAFGDQVPTGTGATTK
jgi:hypothetical protein